MNKNKYHKLPAEKFIQMFLLFLKRFLFKVNLGFSVQSK